MTKRQKWSLARIVAAAVLLAALFLIKRAYDDELSAPVWLALYLIPYLTVGYDVLLKAGRGIIRGQVLDENFLMAAASVGALALAYWQRDGEYAEAVAVMLFYQIGELFESVAVGRSRRSIASLMDIRPDFANLEQDGVIRRIDPDEAPVGSILLVRPGERVPIDGVVIDGVGTLDTAALTGESLPRQVGPGDEIVSGCVSLTGALRVRTTKLFGQSTVSRILELVEQSASRKSRSENFISRFARVYTPAVCAAAVALALLPPLAGLILGADPAWSQWAYRALTFLVISCPCALVISVPMSFFAGLGGASREGILIKGSNYLEALSRTRIAAFDKTGTVTMGVFSVSGIHHSPDERELLDCAAHAECLSLHPIAESIRRAYLKEAEGRELDRGRVSEVEELGGNGVTATVDGRRVAVGNDRLMRRLDVSYIDCRSTGTIVHAAVDGSYAGHIVIEDQVKPTAEQALKQLRELGVTRTVMLTGDTPAVGEAVAAQLGFDEVRAGLLPEDKVAAVEALISTREKNETLIFVGDGVNDAPVLARADVGVAMGALGSDAAVEAADVVLMNDDPMGIVTAIRIAKKCMRIVYENIWLAIGVKALCLILGALGWASMWLAIFADVGVMVLAVLNATRTLFLKEK